MTPLGRRGGAVLAGLLVASVLTLVADAAQARFDPPPPVTAPALDGYGGLTSVSLGATGRFRLAEVDGRWWLVTPDGHPFFSAGVNHTTPYGTTDRNGGRAYWDTVQAKYGSIPAWADAQVERFGEWGFNTLGGWSTYDAFAGKLPYTVLFSFAGQNFVSGRMDDFWDPAWAAGVEATAQAVAAPRADDPWLVGYFLDNELHWNKDFRFLDQLDLYLDREATAPGKVHLLGWLADRYGGDFAAFAADFDSDATGWDDLAEPTVLTDVGPGAQPTRAAWAGAVAERYFSITDAALEAADPDHLNLGARFLTQITVPEVVAAAGRYVDVLSVNWYDIKPEWEEVLAGLGPAYLPTTDTLVEFHRLTGRPLLVSEFGYRALDSGLPNTWPPFQVVLDTQTQRAAAYQNYVDCLINTGYVVGAHWFEHADEPAIGRSDGEDDNWGLVTEGDEPYELVVETAATLHDHAFAPLTDPGQLPFACDPVGPQIEPPPSTTSTTTSTSVVGPTTTTSVAGTPIPSAVPVATARPVTPASTTPAFTG